MARAAPDRSLSCIVQLSFAPVAQLDRAPGYEPGGREFESLRAHHHIFGLRNAAGQSSLSAAIRTPGRQQAEFDNPASAPGWTLPRSAAAVRSAAEDERRSREQSLRAHHNFPCLVVFLPRDRGAR